MNTKNSKKIGLLSILAVIVITAVLAATVLTSSAAYADGIPAEFTENTDPAKDYAYSFAVVGDTQKHVYRDVYYGKDTTSYIYDWIVANKDSKKISLVMGLGDITDKDGVDQTADDGIDQTDLEWDIAVEQHAKLENAGIPYTLVRGNHDTVAKLDEYFAANPNFTGGEIGYYSGTSLGNYYMKFTIGGHNYMVFVFDYGPHNDILTWASGEIAANPDYKVILTTHAYMYKDGTTLDINDNVPPRKANYTSSRNNGNDIWYKLASQYENIILVLSGHDPNNDIVWRQDLGDNGNTVTQFLIDPQSLDSKQGYTTGMVAMFYFSEDGSRVKVEYVSTYHSLENGEGKDYVYNASKNCFEFTIPEKVEMQPVATENYGVIDAKYSNPETYPIVAFEKTTDGYAFIGGYYDLGDAENAIVNTTGAWNKDFVILLRGNAEARTYKNFSQLTKNLTLDLNGYQLTHCGQTYLFYIWRNVESTVTDVDVRVNFTVKNGTILKASDYYSLFALDYSAKCNRPYSIPMTFENVTFRSTGDGYSLFRSIESAYTDLAADNKCYVETNAVFNNCTFDYKNSRAGVKMLDLTNENGYDRAVYKITINGGKIIAGSAFSKADFIAADGNANGRADSVVFGADANGKYTELILPRGTEAPSENDKYLTVIGEELAFVRTAYDDETETYTISSDKPVVPPSTSTPYGDIDEEFIDVDAYPIVVFYKNGDTNTFVGGYADLGAANKAILNLNAPSKDYIILLRNNAAVNTATSVSALTGSYTLDLNGYTLKINYYYAIFIQRNYATTNKRATFTFKNGNIENAYEKGSVICIQYMNKCASSFTVPFVFDNVTLTCSASKSNYGLIRASEDYYNNVADDGFYVDADVTFNNCIFDLNSSKSLMKMLDMTSYAGGDRVVCNVKVNGGSIIAKDSFSYSDLIAMDGNANGRADKLTFGKNKLGEYTTLVLSKGANAPSTSEIYLNESGAECIFAKASEGVESVVYCLRPVATLGFDFAPKMSITLESQLVLNVYIPVKSLLKFTFDDENYENLTLLENTKKTIEGKEYYRISTPLASADAATSLKLVANVDMGTGTAKATFTFSIPKYCAKLIASETSSEAEKTLARDVLLYVKEAYKYFDGFNTAEEIASTVALIESIIGNYAGTPEKSGAVNTVAPVIAAALNLGEKPTIRFYVSDTNVSFYLNGSKLDTVSGVDANGSYVELDVYAYALCETITYGDGGSYHISSYVNGAIGKDYEALVKSFVKYTESAAEYRNTIIGVVHSYTAKIVPPTCVTQGYTLYTCTDCGYSYEDDYVDAHGHAWGEWFVSEEITKTSDGKMRQNCSNCDGFNLKDIAVVKSDNFGAKKANNATYTIYEDGTLKITGTGTTYDCGWNGGNQPFVDYRESIKRVIVSDGITQIGQGSFAYLPNLEYADLSSSITEYPRALFMDSFKTDIRSVVVPENITKIDALCFGRYNASNALFTEVYILNPDVIIVERANSAGTPYLFVNTYVSRCSELVIYSYGSNNNVKAYADKFGLNYADLNSNFTGTEGNVSYSYANGKLTLSAIDVAQPATLPSASLWLDRINKADVTEIVISTGIDEIPDGYFAGYTSLTRVSIADGIKKIGATAFATESACNNSLIIQIGDGLADLGADFLQNRTNVTLSGFSGTALDGFEQDGVSIALKKALKILLIGNSLSNDAADVNAGKSSKLYDIIKAMVGDDVHVEIGVLYSGAKTAEWHASVAKENSASYTFYLISPETNNVWLTYTNYSSAMGLSFDAWDVVTLQPYGNEALTGSSATGEGEFANLSSSLPFMLDYVNNYCDTAEVYYYLTWSNSQKVILNDAASKYGTMLSVAKQAMEYVGTDSNKGFDGLIPVGTSIQNARSTYLALQYYVTDNDSDSKNFVTSLQRDNVHLSLTVGRYIAALSFAEILVPDELRLASYTLPEISASELVGELPLEFTELAKLSVNAMLNTLDLSGDAQYSYTVIEGYEIEPSTELAEIVADTRLESMSVADKAELLASIKRILVSVLPNDADVFVSMTQGVSFSDEYKDYTVDISVRYGYASTTVSKSIKAKLNGPTAEVVNKNGTDATVTFVIDDGEWNTARFAKEMLLKYSGLTVSFAVPVKQLATLSTQDSDGDGIPEYVMSNGKYVYEVNTQSYDFWMDILDSTRAEIINHSFTHGFWGTNDDGGTFEYVKNSEKNVTISDLMPKGSVTKEIYASKQILEELFKDYISPNATALSFITPGNGIRTSNYTLEDGRVIPTYKTYFDSVLKNAYDAGDLIGANSTFGATYDPTLDLRTKVVTKDNFGAYENRMKIPRYMVEHYNANPEGIVNDDISNWTDYIDAAIELNGWSCFCIHMMLEKASANGHNITWAQAEKLFNYANDKNVWIATNTEATLYFSEWSTSSVYVEYENGEIKVNLTDNERDDVYNTALTVKVSVPDEWTKVTSGDSIYDVIKGSDGVSYVLVDIVPDSGIVTLSEAN